jgi:hypothetical protein
MKLYRGAVCALCAAVCLLLAGLAGAQEKYALVIGNAAYTKVSPLRNTVNDAADVKAALGGLGFEVELLTNATLRQMTAAVDSFARKLGAAPKAYGFFYYSGHGVQAQGENFLIPVDADIRREADVAYDALHVQRALDYMQEAGNALNIVVLDACRDNPFSWARSGSRGLSVTRRQPPGSVIVYATSEGSTASDGSGRNGLFTTELLKHLKNRELEVNEIFRRTGADVSRASGNKQIPAIYSKFFETAWLGGAPSRPEPRFGQITAAVGNLEVAAVTAGTLNIRGGGLDRDVPFTVGGTLPVNGLQTGAYRLTMNYRDGKTEEKTVEVEAGRTAKAAFSYRIPQSAVKVYSIGERGPAGGWIFYDKGSYTDGWRYLEAAPRDAGKAAWGLDGEAVAGTQTAVGSGRKNTQLIMQALRQAGETGMAAQLCDVFEAGGFADWFLPSKDELNLMYTSLHKNGLGNFSEYVYWSSSEYNSNHAWPQSFGSDNQVSAYRGNTSYCVRAIRAF